MLPGMATPIARRPRVRIVAVAQATTSGTAHTFSGVNFGAPFPGRVLIACVALRDTAGSAIDQIACTIGGVTAAGDDDGEFLSGGPAIGAGIWAAAVPTGQSGDVFVDWTGQTAPEATLILLSVDGFSATAHDQQSPGGGGSGGTSRTDTVDIPAGGLLVVAASHTNNNNTTLSGVTERSEQTVGVGQFAVGWDFHLAQETGRTITSSWTTTAARGLRLASYPRA